MIEIRQLVFPETLYEILSPSRNALYANILDLATLILHSLNLVWLPPIPLSLYNQTTMAPSPSHSFCNTQLSYSDRLHSSTDRSPNMAYLLDSYSRRFVSILPHIATNSSMTK